MDRPAGRVESGPRTVQILAGRVGSGYAISGSGWVRSQNLDTRAALSRPI